MPLEIANLGDLIRSDIAPDRLALHDLRPRGRTWTHGELEAAAESFAGALLAHGVRPGDRVGILAENSAEFLIAYMGTMRAAGIAVPANFRLPADTVRYVFADSQVRLVVVDADLRYLAPADVPQCVIDGSGPDGFDAWLCEGPSAGPRPEAPLIAEILYTSGSTGRPKGVELSHAGQIWALGKHVLEEPAVGERTVIVAPMYHMNALFNISAALLNGVEIVLMPRFDARAFLEAVSRFQCTTLSGIPTMFAMMTRQQDLWTRLDLTSVRNITIASAPLTEALVDRVREIFPNAQVRNGYGTTEAGPSIFGEHPTRPRPPLALGCPLPDVEVRLAGEHPDEGVLEVRTPALLSGYLNLPEATREKLRDGWYSTGDIMRRDADGFFYFVGRADDMFVCGGENVYPGEVEKMLERHPSVLQAAVVAVPDDLKGQIPIAFVVLRDATISPEELKAFSLREGPAFSHPRAIIPMDELPVAGTHKLDKRPLMPRALAAALALAR